jgi:hypothetical protein
MVESEFGGSLESGGQFCVGILHESGVSRRQNVFTFNFYIL